MTTATQLPQEQIDKIVQLIRDRLGDITLEVNQLIDPQLIGGFTVKVGDTLLDASVKNELNKMRLNLLR